MGKLVFAFLFYSASAGLAVHEATAPPSRPIVAPPVLRAPIAVERVNEPEKPATVDPTRFARPFYIRPLPPPDPPPPPPPPPVNLPAVAKVDVETSGDVPDIADRCPEEQTVTGEKNDEDGCPESVTAVRTEPSPRVVIRFEEIID